MLICNEEICTGCMACYNICSKNAINFKEDREGFFRPVINEEKCTKCNRCKRVCPSNELTIERNMPKKTYACWVKDEELRKGSTSGGIFSALAEVILRKDGVVFGVELNHNLKAIHGVADKMHEVSKFRGSKYVQSEIGTIFKNVKQYLEEERSVLFTGTPCQIAGLYGYLGKDYENLITCDLVCHGVPSPRVYQDYLTYIKKRYKSNPKEIKFRFKKPSWRVFSMYIKFENDREYIKDTNHDPYIVGFLRNYFLRPSCYKCQFTTPQRQGDLTIADFWGYKGPHDEKGISLTLANSEKGESVLKECANIHIVERTLEEAIAGNACLSHSFDIPQDRAIFWKDYNEKSFEEIIKKYFYPKKLSLKMKIYNLTTYQQRELIKKVIKSVLTSLK